MAQLVERILGKDEVISSTLISSSRSPIRFAVGLFAVLLSGFLVELCLADRAGYRYLALSFRHTESILAVWTGEVAVGLYVVQAVILQSEPFLHGIPDLQKRGSLAASRLLVLREYPEDRPDQREVRGYLEPYDATDPRGEGEHHPEDHERVAELVDAVSSVHEPAELIHYINISFPPPARFHAGDSVILSLIIYSNAPEVYPISYTKRKINIKPQKGLQNLCLWYIIV